MPPDLLSFLNKLSNDNTSYKLEWQGTNIDTKYLQLKKRFRDLPFNKLLSLAILLQHLDINLFTERELIAVSRLNVESIVNQKSNNFSKVLSKNKPLFDTNSSRLFDLIKINNISFDNIQLDTSSFLNFTSFVLKEIIVNLYTRGY